MVQFSIRVMSGMLETALGLKDCEGKAVCILHLVQLLSTILSLSK